jgi:hypothetical protein
MSNEEKELYSKQKIEFESAITQRNFEIDLFWKRSWFFGVLVIAEIAAYYKVKADHHSLLPVLISFITCFTMFAQCLMNRGSKYWQERWEYITMNREAALKIDLTRLKKFENDSLNDWLLKKYDYNNRNEWFFIEASILSKGENQFTLSRRFSVSKITFLVWDVIFICSFLCWLNESYNLISLRPDWFLTVKFGFFYFFIFGYILLFWYKGKVYEPFKKEFLEMKKEEIQEIEDKYLKDEVNVPFKFYSND